MAAQLSRQDRLLIGAAGVLALAATPVMFVAAYLLGTPGSVDGSGFLQDDPTASHYWAGLGGMGLACILAVISVVALSAAGTGNPRAAQLLQRIARPAAAYVLFYLVGFAVIDTVVGERTRQPAG